jgi:hypothetical protein
MIPENLVLSAPVTHSDWMWNHQKRIGHGKKSVKYILDRCKSVGWQKVYWRCFDSGQAMYTSKLMDSIAVGWDKDNYHAWVPTCMKDFETSLKTAKKLGAKQILYWESDYLDAPGHAEFTKELLKK